MKLAELGRVGIFWRAWWSDLTTVPRVYMRGFDTAGSTDWGKAG